MRTIMTLSAAAKTMKRHFLQMAWRFLSERDSAAAWSAPYNAKMTETSPVTWSRLQSAMKMLKAASSRKCRG